MIHRSRSLARLQVAVMLGVVASFVAATGVATVQARSIDRDVAGLVQDVVPSVEALAAARGNLHRIESFLDHRLSVAARGAVVSEDALAALRQGVEGALARYLTFPFFPGERERFADVRSSVTTAETDVEHAADLIGRGDLDQARLATSVAREDIDRADLALERLEDFDALQGQRLAVDAEKTRTATMRTAFLLDGIAVALALLATALTVYALRRRVDQIEQASASAEQRSSELEQFAGRVAHDVLSPLMAVGLGLELLRPRAAGDPRSERAVARARSSLARVRRIVDGLLEFAKAGAQPDRRAHADVEAVVADVVDGVRADAEAAGIAVSADSIPPVEVACAPGLLTSILSNLVRNAVKYMGDAEEKRVVIRVAASERVRFEVEDTGPGIPPGLGGKLFEPFVRGPEAQRVSGAGLGLATVKRLVEAHGGELGYASRTGGGTVFWCELPR